MHLQILSTSDLAGIEIPPAEVIEVVEKAYLALARGASANPRKLTVKSVDGRSVAYAMLGLDGARQLVGIKTSYKNDPQHSRAKQHYYTSLMLYDDETGLPIALMDCSRIGSMRTPAVSALIARECAAADARSVLLIGTGTQGRQALPYLLATLPRLDRLMVFGTHPDGIAAVRDELRRHHPDRVVEVVGDVRAAAAEADVILAVAGSSTPAAVEADWLRPGALCILVGYGLAPSTLHRADYAVATSFAQMAVTGTDLVDANGALRAVDAELPDILAGSAIGREHDQQRIFAYNSGLVLTDIALGHRFVELAVAQGLGQAAGLWQ